MEIVPASPAVWPALAELFAAGGDPKWCWCQFWRKPGANWTNTTPAENRADLEALAGADPAPGLVALRDGVAVGWIGLGPREDFPRLGRSRTIPQLPGDAVWVVNCFVVAKGARRTGVASALLEAAVTTPASTGRRSSRATRSAPAASGSRLRPPTREPPACSSGRVSRWQPRPRRRRRAGRHAWSCAARPEPTVSRRTSLRRGLRRR